MADRITDPRLAGERLLTFAREGRLVQAEWWREKDGREFACLLGAAAGITDAQECPASLMPAWLACVLPGLFDGQTAAHSRAFARRWGEAMIRPEWARIDWYSVRAEWLAFVVAQAKHATAAAAAAAAAAADAWAAANAAAEAADAAAAADAADAYADARAHALHRARDAQADAIMDAIEKAMEVGRG